MNKLLEDFVVLRGEAWRGATADAPDQGQQLLADALQKYQVGCWGRLERKGLYFNKSLHPWQHWEHAAAKLLLQIFAAGCHLS